LFPLAVGLVLAWKVAGQVGLDLFLLRWLGTPWTKNTAEAEDLIRRRLAPESSAAAGE
jgi:hypothetical protein